MPDRSRRGPRRALLLAAAAAVVLFALAFVNVDQVQQQRTQPGPRDLDFYALIAARVAAGDPYYQVLAEVLPAYGYPVRPAFSWRLPTTAWLLATLRSRSVAQAMLWAIGAMAIWAWARALSLRTGALALIVIAPLWLLFSGMGVYMHELWAGQLIALGLSLWLIDRPRAALAALLAAALLREHAALALGIVAIDAWRRDRSSRLWAAAIGVVVVAYVAHLVTVVRHTPSEGITNGWGGMLGWAFVVSSIQSHVLLIAPPYWVAALVAAVCVPALWLWREGRIVAVIVTAYAVVFCTIARPDNWYWGLLIVPLVPLGCIALVSQAVSPKPIATAPTAAEAPGAGVGAG